MRFFHISANSEDSYCRVNPRHENEKHVQGNCVKQVSKNKTILLAIIYDKLITLFSGTIQYCFNNNIIYMHIFFHFYLFKVAKPYYDHSLSCKNPKYLKTKHIES